MRTALLRAASILTALFTAGHSMGTFGEPRGAMVPAATVMKSVHFELFGADRTYWQMFHGYGVLIIFAAAYMTVLYWMRPPRNVLLLTAAMQAGFAAISFADFFWAPGLMNGLSAVLVLIAAARE